MTITRTAGVAGLRWARISVPDRHSRAGRAGCRGYPQSGERARRARCLLAGMLGTRTGAY